MARPYSLDLRERVVAAVESGRRVREFASSFGVSVSSLVKWSQRYRRTGSAAASRWAAVTPWPGGASPVGSAPAFGTAGHNRAGPGRGAG
jgi:transposase-like protein